MGPDNMPVGIVYQEIYRAALHATDTPDPRQALANLRDTIAAWYGVEPEEIKLSWDGHELSCRISMERVEDITFRLTPEGYLEARR